MRDTRTDLIDAMGEALSKRLSLAGIRSGNQVARSLLRANGCRTTRIEYESSGAIKSVTVQGHSRQLTCPACKAGADAR